MQFLNSKIILIGTVLCITLCIFSLNAEFDANVEELFLKNIEQFVKDEENTLKELKEFQNYIETIHNLAKQDENYLRNPLNEFLIVKRLILDWHYIVSLTTQKRWFLKDFYANFTSIMADPNHPTLSNLRDSVLNVAEALEKQGIDSVGEFLMTLVSDPYTKLTASDYAFFNKILNALDKDTSAETWKMEGKIAENFDVDPLLELLSKEDTIHNEL